MATRHNLPAYEAAGLHWHHVPVPVTADGGRRAGRDPRAAARRAAAGGRGRGARQPPHGLRGRGVRRAPARASRAPSRLTACARPPSAGLTVTAGCLPAARRGLRGADADQLGQRVRGGHGLRPVLGGLAGVRAAEHQRGVQAAAPAAATSESSRSPTTRVRPSPSRSSAASISWASGLPTIAAVCPDATSTAASSGRCPATGRRASAAWDRGRCPAGRRSGGPPAPRRAAAGSRSGRCRPRRPPRPRSRAAVPFTTVSPASATWRCSTSVPITNAVRPGRVSASRCCSAPPTVTTSASEAWTPMPHRLWTCSSPECQELLVANATRLPAARSAAIASGEPGTAVSPTRTQPSRSRITWS